MTETPSLLEADEPPAFTVVRQEGKAPYLLACDHAGRRIPRRLGDLAVAKADLESHIAWDIGIEGLARRLAPALDAFLIVQTYSRLVIDCNRPLVSPQSIVATSAEVDVPGNRDLSRVDAEMRRDSIFRPYHERIREEIDRRQRDAHLTIFVALHSFTPNFLGAERRWHAGVLFNRDRRVADVLLELLRQEPGLVVGENEPYAASESTDFSIVEHAERRGALHVELEVRQDLIADDRGQAEWAERFARLFVRASERFRF